MKIWEKLARKDPEFYILSVEGVDFTSEEGKQYFYQSGIEFTQITLGRVADLIKDYGLALEIGCGIGRLTFPHAKRFNQVSAVDISATMQDKLRQTASKWGITNIRTFFPDEDWDRLAYDYIYSFIVFQHISEKEIIENYISRIANCLKANGVAQLQFDTRPNSLAYLIRNWIPDIFLPRTQKKGIRRVRRSTKYLKGLFTANGLILVNELYPHSANHTFILTKNN
jgi:SAM-dependent methyltransferase